MKLQTFNIGAWLYPDSSITAEKNAVSLDSAKNGDICFQILTKFIVQYQEAPRHFPPGNHVVSYTDGENLYDSVMAHVQRISAAEDELLLRLSVRHS